MLQDVSCPHDTLPSSSLGTFVMLVLVVKDPWSCSVVNGLLPGTSVAVQQPPQLHATAFPTTFPNRLQVPEDKDAMNGVQQLAVEATAINQNFSQQVPDLFDFLLVQSTVGRGLN